MKSLIYSLTLALAIAFPAVAAPTIASEKAALAQAKDAIFSERDPVRFVSAIAKAKKLGISPQAILEAKFLYYIDAEDYPAIIKITPEFEAMLKTFNPDNSQLFATVEDWKSVIEYGHALKALEQKNIPEFKKHITEAFWLSPDKASAFSHHITRLRINDAMQKITLKPDRSFKPISGDARIDFQTMLKGKDALILRFWSPWHQQIDTTYPLLANLAQQCAKNNIGFASFILTQEPQIITDAREVIKESASAFPSYWLMDNKKNSLARLLRITDLPTIVIVTKDRKITFNGSPLDKHFWQEIAKIQPKIKFPTPSSNAQE